MFLVASSYLEFKYLLEMADYLPFPAQQIIMPIFTMVKIIYLWMALI